MASQYHDLSLARYAEERKHLQRQGFTEVDERHDGILGTWQGSIMVPIGEDREALNVTIQLVFPDGYPWQKPSCIPVEPAYRRCQHQRPDDMPITKWPNQLCIWEDHAGGWDPSFGLGEIIDKVRRWVKATELGWRTRSAEEAAVFDPERYFANMLGPIYFSDGLNALNGSLGTLDVQALDHCMVVTAIDGVQCPGAIITTRLLGITSPQKPIIIPYIVCSQPSFPLFADLSGLLQELTQQGFDRTRVIQHLGDTASGQSGCGTVVIAYEAIDARVACGLRYELPDTVPGFRRGRAPTILRVKRAIAVWSRFASYKVVCLDSETLLRRNPYRMRGNDLCNAKVAVFGLGSIGSQVAELLAKGGVDKLLLVDADKIEAGNVVRHTIGLESVGQ